MRHKQAEYDQAELSKLMAQVVKLVADVAQSKGVEADIVSGKLDTLNTELASILEEIEDIRNQTVPKQQQWDLEGQNSDQIYQQCMALANDKFNEIVNSEYVEYNYLRFTTLGKDDYGNITDGRMDIRCEVFLPNNTINVEVGFDIVHSYILEPLYVEYFGKKLFWDQLKEEIENIESYYMDYNRNEEFKLNPIENPPMGEGKTAYAEFGQKEYPLFSSPDPMVVIPSHSRKMINN